MILINLVMISDSDDDYFRLFMTCFFLFYKIKGKIITILYQNFENNMGFCCVMFILEKILDYI